MSISRSKEPEYFLARHAYCALTDNALILLDIKTDDYIMIEPHMALRFLDLLSVASGEREERSAELNELVANLERRGSITPHRQAGKSADMLEMITGNREVPGPLIDDIPRIGIGHVFNMISALAVTFYLLKIRGLPSAVRHVSRLRTRTDMSDRAHDASEVVEIYHRVRPFFYSAKGNCLFNALSMISFLSKYGICPYWCFGVKMNPFEAHCWVEDGQWLYNDRYSRTWRFAPIMRI